MNCIIFGRQIHARNRHCEDLVHRLQKVAADAGAQRVASATVWLGALSQFSPEHLREHFLDEARGTVAEGAMLAIEQSNDPLDPAAQHVVIESVELEV